jgi:hypothetical protein
MKVYSADVEHIVKWCAHRVQRPGDKINHALVLGGAHGVGKTTGGTITLGPRKPERILPTRTGATFGGSTATAAPFKTQAFWEVVHASRAPEYPELADCIDALGAPEALTLAQIIAKANDIMAFDFAQ